MHEYVNILEKTTKFLRVGGHPYLKRGPPKPMPLLSKLGSQNVSYAKQHPGDLPEGFKSRDHVEKFLAFFNSYLKRTTKSSEILLRLIGSDAVMHTDTSKLKYFRMRLKKAVNAQV